MAATITFPSPATAVNVEYISSNNYTAKLPPTVDPFRHASLANSHNHHDLHPWGAGVKPNSDKFDALYAEANNKYMYHLWYTPDLAPFMATKMISINPISADMLGNLEAVLRTTLRTGVDTAMGSPEANILKEQVERMLEKSGIQGHEKIFIRLGATSAKDSFAIDVPTTKPTPMSPDPDMIVRRLLTSGRCVGRLLALCEGVWREDPGEALIIEQWSPEIELRREFRVFCYQGKITAISQDIWWEKLGWRDEYSDGFVEAITSVWAQVKALLPFDSCTMDVLMRKAVNDSGPWTAKIIEFNAFGAHLNTGSDLFHWTRDAEILHGQRGGITVRFVDDLEQGGEVQVPEKIQAPNPKENEPDMPDWLALETKLRASYGGDATEQTPLKMDPKVKLPLRGRWCSAF